MWILFALGSALFSGITSILAKCGIKNTDSNTATALRTIAVLIMSWIMVFITGSYQGISQIETKTILFLILSGLSTGMSWLCYFRALQIGDINKVTPVDKSSTILTMLFAALFLNETLNKIKIISIIFLAVGTYLMIQKKQIKEKKQQNISWLIYAFGSAIFASMTSILGKIGIEGIDSTLGTGIRTIIVLIFAWTIVFASGKWKTISKIDKKSWIFLGLSGIATGASWLCYYRALQTGPASIVVPIDKLSILVTITVSYFVFHEKLHKKSIIGLVFLIIGTVALLL